ncbi:4620_t:CDS:2, partial [Acaulospora colombiana]
MQYARNQWTLFSKRTSLILQTTRTIHTTGPTPVHLPPPIAPSVTDTANSSFLFYTHTSDRTKPSNNEEQPFYKERVEVIRWGEEDDTATVGLPRKDLREEIKK